MDTEFEDQQVKINPTNENKVDEMSPNLLV